MTLFKVVAQWKSHFQERRPSDGRSCYIAADGRRPCDGARRCQALSFCYAETSAEQASLDASWIEI